MLADSIARVNDRIARAAARAGRRPEDITLIAVTKKFPPAVIREAYQLGLRHFGENYVQEWETKATELHLPDARVHLIGHLQSNKTRRAADLFQSIDTIDSSRLARRLGETGAELDVLIEVKLSNEQAKTGALPEDVGPICDAVSDFSNLHLLGLMTVPPWSEDPEISRPYFARLRELAGRHSLPHLSMGMSHDVEAAIEEGATLVRVGTALFGRRSKP